jgi:glycine hydroxymethyltransferase
MLQQQDPLLYDLIQKEAHRQDEEIELIASENYVSKAVLEANGSILTNKYSE